MIEVYVSIGCPYCEKVMRALNQQGLVEGEHFEVIDAGPGTSGRQTLLEIGGKPMVPFIRYGESSMYESDDIIAFLKDTFPVPPKKGV